MSEEDILDTMTVDDSSTDKKTVVEGGSESYLSKIYNTAVGHPNILLAIVVLLVIWTIYSWCISTDIYTNYIGGTSKRSKKKKIEKEESDNDDEEDEVSEKETDDLIKSIEKQQNE